MPVLRRFVCCSCFKTGWGGGGLCVYLFCFFLLFFSPVLLSLRTCTFLTCLKVKLYYMTNMVHSLHFSASVRPGPETSGPQGEKTWSNFYCRMPTVWPHLCVQLWAAFSPTVSLTSSSLATDIHDDASVTLYFFEKIKFVFHGVMLVYGLLTWFCQSGMVLSVTTFHILFTHQQEVVDHYLFVTLIVSVPPAFQIDGEGLQNWERERVCVCVWVHAGEHMCMFCVCMHVCALECDNLLRGKDVTNDISMIHYILHGTSNFIPSVLCSSSNSC